MFNVDAKRRIYLVEFPSAVWVTPGVECSFLANVEVDDNDSLFIHIVYHVRDKKKKKRI